MTQNIKISELPSTVLPTVEHEIPSMKNGVTVKLTVQQVVDIAISLISDGAPEALNTLNEIAAAINDDDEIVTTLTALINQKLSSSGGTLSGNLDLNGNSIQGMSSNWNWIINGEFSINQRSASSKSQPVNVYGFDRWKGHASGIEQVVENMPADTFTLTWEGGGSGFFDGLSGNSPITKSITQGDISVVIPSNATNVRLLKGTRPSETENHRRPRVLEEFLCKMYYEEYPIDTTLCGYHGSSGVREPYYYNVVKRAVPSVTLTNVVNGSGSSIPITASNVTREAFLLLGTTTPSARILAALKIDAEIY